MQHKVLMSSQKSWIKPTNNGCSSTRGTHVVEHIYLQNTHNNYSRFQVTFQCNIPNFVGKFGSSLPNSKVHFKIHKSVCKLSIWLASLSSGANHSLFLQTGLWILKWTFEFRNELPNLATKFGILHSFEKLSEIDCNTRVIEITVEMFEKFCANLLFQWY